MDALALAVIRKQGQLAEAMKNLREDDRFWLNDGTALIWDKGHVWSGSNNEGGQLSWNRSVVTIGDFFMPETLCTAAAGRPITDFVAHPILTSDMVVAEANCLADDGETSVSFRLVDKPLHFDLETSHLWSDDESSA